MAAASNYLETEVVNHVLRNIPYTSPTNVYVGLFGTSQNLEGNVLTDEVTGGSYARQLVSFTVPSDGLTSNSGDITFADMPAFTVTHFGIIDTNTLGSGNVLVWGALDTPRTVSAGDSLVFQTGNLSVTLA